MAKTHRAVAEPDPNRKGGAMKKLARDFYQQNYACSEAVVKAAAAKGLIPEDCARFATGFGRGMSSGCLCGAIAGAQMVIGAVHGRTGNDQDAITCQAKAQLLITEFKKQYRVTCCRVLSGKLPADSPERKARCTGIVGDVAEILERIVAPQAQRA